MIAAVLAPSPTLIAELAVGAFVAGFINSIAGGGGLITVPLLMATGLPTPLALGTNKGQAVFGAASSVYGFAARGEVDRPRALPAFVAAGVGGLFGAFLQSLLDKKTLEPLCLVLLVAALGTLFLPKRAPSPMEAEVPEVNQQLVPRSRAWIEEQNGFLLAGFACLLGTYDGFFGPGTGTLLAIGYERFFGDGVVRASGNAKVANFASNLTAFSLALFQGNVRFSIALPMAAASIVGSLVGARVAVKGGAVVVRYAIVAAVLALVAKIGHGLLVR